MDRKRNSLICIALLSVSAWCGSAMGAVRDGYLARSPDVRQDNADYVVSRQLCQARVAKPGALPEARCVPSVTDDGGEWKTDNYFHRRLAFDDITWNTIGPAFEVTSGGEIAVARLDTGDGSQQPLGSDEAGQVVASISSDAQSPRPTSDASSHSNEETPMRTAEGHSAETTTTNNASIPGSLLVTILALIGIVAVARRDVAGKGDSSSSGQDESATGDRATRHTKSVRSRPMEHHDTVSHRG